MRLKRLVLQGYKTFANKTEFVFDEGITSIIGPNGSGKSNVADAVRWVLGEQSYTTLRGRRTTDMIFTGSRSRPRAGIASVTLTLDNSDGWLPIDYTEVEIGRRAYRSGENEYILNGQKVRLKDVSELLATSGLAERTYTIIGQGLVDQALSLRADERRALFEEAAGISHYKVKRAQAVRRLEETRHNLERVHDILAEIRPRLGSLKRQAVRARNYEQVAADLRNLLRIWYGFRWEQAKKQMRSAREAAEAAESAWQESRETLENRQERMGELQRESGELRRRIAEIQGSRDDLRERLAEQRRSLAVLQERRQAIERQLSDIVRELPILSQQRSVAQNDLTQALSELDMAQTELGESQQRLSQFDANSELGQAQVKVSELQKKRENVRQKRRQLAAELEKQRREGRNQEQRLMKLRNDLVRLEARAELLNQMHQGLMESDPDAQVVSRLAGHMTIPDGVEVAVEAALRGRLATVIAPGIDELWKLIEQRSENQALTAVALSHIRPEATPPTPVHEAVIDWAANLVQSDEQIRPLIQLLLGRVLLVKDDPQAAFSMAQALPGGFSVVTQSGFVAHAGGLVEWPVPDLWHGILTAEKEQQRAGKEISQLSREVVQLENEVSGKQADLLARQEEIAGLQDEEERLAQLELEASRQFSEIQQQRTTVQQRLRSSQTIVAGRQAVVDSRLTTLGQLDRQILGLDERQKSLQERYKESHPEDHASRVEQLAHRQAQLDDELAPVQEGLRKSREALTRLEEEVVSLRRHSHHCETLHTQAKIALSQQQTQMEGLQDRIRADLGLVALSYDDDQTGPTPLPMSEVVEQLPVSQEIPGDIEESIQHYRGQMQRMGAVNPDAPAEYEETQNRYDFLNQQIEDLEKTECQLRQIIEDLDELTAKAFVETVEKVNSVFGEVFTELFGGGSARLALTDPDDPINSGVDINARLPNRREQGLALLSGGERSLTAVALIFSLLKVAPTPFCVLDEVDAALDEANINRFRDMLRELSARTQFVIITHNRGTVQVARTLYGISMGADSTSQAISIRPEEYVRQSSLV